MPSEGPSAATNQKGQRNERKAAKILGRVHGRSHVDKVARLSNNDPLRFIDVLGSKEGWPVRFVQVKTNRFAAKDRRKYGQLIRSFSESVVCEVWVRVDREGWRFYRYDRGGEEWRQFIEMDTCDYEETVKAFRDAVDFWEKQEATE